MGQARNGTGMKWVPFELFIMDKARFGMGPKWVRTEMEQSGPKWDGPDMGRAPNGQARNGRPEVVRPEMAGPEMGYTPTAMVRLALMSSKIFIIAAALVPSHA